MNKNRFKELLRSTMGDVRPLVSEQGETPPFIPQTPRTSSSNPEGPDTLPDNVVEPSQTSPTPPEQPNDGKKDLIRILKNHLQELENESYSSAYVVADTIYTACAHWINKTSTFKNRPGQPYKTKVPYELEH
jgi:hypothetical protein